MTREGRKYLTTKLEETTKQAEKVIRELSAEKESLSKAIVNYRYKLNRLANSKFIPAFKYFLKLRKEMK